MSEINYTQPRRAPLLPLLLLSLAVRSVHGQTMARPISITCNRASQWQATENDKVTQYDCNICNHNSSPAKNVQLSCSNYQPTASWNIQPTGPNMCALGIPILYQAGCYNFGYQTLLPSPAVFYLMGNPFQPNSLKIKPSSTPLVLSCSQDTSFVSGGTVLFQNTCKITNPTAQTAASIKLMCHNFRPSMSWNIHNYPNSLCSLPFPLPAGATKTFGFQTPPSDTQLQIMSYVPQAATS